MQYRTPFVSTAILLIILVFYFTRPKLPLRSTRLFTAFLLLSCVNILAEISTLFTIYHIAVPNELVYVAGNAAQSSDHIIVPDWVNRLCHQLFIGSLDITIYFLYSYVEAKAYRQKRNSLLKGFLKATPLIGSLIMVVFGKLKYHIWYDGRYSYGQMAETVYASAAIYIIGVVVLLIMHREEFKCAAWITILGGIAVWAGIAIYQFFNPTALISSIALMLMVVALFFAFENPRDFNDIEVCYTLNDYAFDLMLAEYVECKKNFYLVTCTLSNDKLLKASLGYKDIPGILTELAKQQHKVTGQIAYHVKENTLCILCKNKETYTALLEKNSEPLKYKNKNGAVFSPEFFTSILEVPKYAQTSDEIMTVLDYINDEGILQQNNGLLVINDEIISQMKKRSAIEILVRNAVENDGFEVYYQPIYSTEKKEFVSSEALVRLKDNKTLGYISPEVFIPIAEHQGMIKQLGLIVFEKVCEFASREKLKEKDIEYIEVNISGIQGVDKSLPGLLKNCMDKYNIAPNFINLEITETASVNAGEELAKNMNLLRDLGCGFSMDDFGTGYSNLAKMIQTHFDLIKLDKSLV